MKEVLILFLVHVVFQGLCNTDLLFRELQTDSDVSEDISAISWQCTQLCMKTSEVAHDNKIRLFLILSKVHQWGNLTSYWDKKVKFNAEVEHSFLLHYRVNAQQKITLSSGRGCFIWLECIRKQNLHSLLVCTETYVSSGLSWQPTLS